MSIITALLRAMSNELVYLGRLTPEAGAAIHKIADRTDGAAPTWRQHRAERLSPPRFCVLCREWVKNPCQEGSFEA